MDCDCDYSYICDFHQAEIDREIDKEEAAKREKKLIARIEALEKRVNDLLAAKAEPKDLSDCEFVQCPVCKAFGLLHKDDIPKTARRGNTKAPKVKCTNCKAKSPKAKCSGKWRNWVLTKR